MRAGGARGAIGPDKNVPGISGIAASSRAQFNSHRCPSADAIGLGSAFRIYPKTNPHTHTHIPPLTYTHIPPLTYHIICAALVIIGRSARDQAVAAMCLQP
jgi:hypothetical protein